MHIHFRRSRPAVATALAAAALTVTTVAAAPAHAAARPVGGVGLSAGHGVVLDGLIHARARVTDADGAPIADATVSFTERYAGSPVTVSRPTGLDGRAYFVFPGVHKGVYTTSATAGGVTSTARGSVVSAGHSHPQEYLKSPSPNIIDLGVRALPIFAGRQVGIYEVNRHNGRRARAANLILGDDATGTYEFRTQSRGRTLAVEVRLLPTANEDYRQYFSAEKDVTVR